MQSIPPIPMAHLFSVLSYINVELFQCGNCVKFFILLYGQLLHGRAHFLVTDLG